MFCIAGQTLSGASNPVSFTNIPSTFTHLQLRYFARSNNASAYSNIYMCVNNDTTNNHYAFHSLTGNGASATSSGSNTNNNNVTIPVSIPAATATTGINGVGIIDILDYSNANKLKTVKGLFGYDANGSGNVGLISGFDFFLATSSLISQIDFYFDGSAIAGSRFDLYGIQTSNATGA
jgi:hypothetical protein